MKKTILSIFFIGVLLFTACDNIDVSKLSDEDLERVSDKLIVCNEPYMRFESGCCLDTDANKICDKDERELTDKESKDEEEVNEQQNENQDTDKENNDWPTGTCEGAGGRCFNIQNSDCRTESDGVYTNRIGRICPNTNEECCTKVRGETPTRSSASYWAAADVAITDYVINSNGPDTFKLRNNLRNAIEVTELKINGYALSGLPVTLGPGGTTTITDDTICNPGEKYSLPISMSYRDTKTGSKYTFTGDGHNLEGVCETVAEEPKPTCKAEYYCLDASHTAWKNADCSVDRSKGKSCLDGCSNGICLEDNKPACTAEFYCIDESHTAWKNADCTIDRNKGKSCLDGCLNGFCIEDANIPEILILERSFEPNEISVCLSDWIRFINKDSNKHQIYVRGGGTKSPTIEPNEDWILQIDEEGSYEILDFGKSFILKVNVQGDCA